MKRQPVRRCIERPGGRGCSEYALPGRSRCAEHDVRGSTPAWRQARSTALERAGCRCQDCGRPEAEVRAAGSRLEVHHLDERAGGIRAKVHDQRELLVLCRACHVETFHGHG